MEQLTISDSLSIPLREIALTAIRAQGPGGQHLNKVATAIQLRFDIPASSLPEEIKLRLLKLGGQQITRDGVVVIKAQRSRSQEQNRQLALQRLAELLQAAQRVPKKRRKTRPTRSSQEKRLSCKNQRSQVKSLRRKIPFT